MYQELSGPPISRHSPVAPCPTPKALIGSNVNRLWPLPAEILNAWRFPLPLLEIPASISLRCLTIDHYAVTSPQAGPKASEPIEDRGATTEFARTPNDRPVEDTRSRRRAHQTASSE